MLYDVSILQNFKGPLWGKVLSKLVTYGFKKKRIN